MAPDRDRDDRDRDDDWNGAHDRRHSSPYGTHGDRLDRLEDRVRQLEMRSIRQTSRIEAAEQAGGELRQLRADVVALQRADAVEEAVESAVTSSLEAAQVKGWGRRERTLALIGGAAIVGSFVLNVAQLIQGVVR